MIQGSVKWSNEEGDLHWLSDKQMAKLELLFPKSHGRP